MRIQKAAAAVLTAALLFVSASAHGGSCHGQRQPASVRPVQTVQTIQSVPAQQTQTAQPAQQTLLRPVCTLADCTAACHHLHDGLPYCGAEHAGGYCDGTCAAAAVSRPVCTAQGCTASGHHLHDGLPYCGAEHAAGFCDGSCQTAAAAPVQTVPAAGHGHHHRGGHH